MEDFPPPNKRGRGGWTFLSSAPAAQTTWRVREEDHQTASKKSEKLHKHMNGQREFRNEKKKIGNTQVPFIQYNLSLRTHDLVGRWRNLQLLGMSTCRMAVANSEEAGELQKESKGLKNWNMSTWYVDIRTEGNQTSITENAFVNCKKWGDRYKKWSLMETDRVREVHDQCT